MKKYLLALPVLLILVFIVGKMSADSAGNAYLDELKKQSASIAKVSNTLKSVKLSELIIAGRDETDAERKAIAQACTKYGTAAKDLKVLQTNTSLSSNGFSFLSSTYKQAQRMQAEDPSLDVSIEQAIELEQGCTFYNQTLVAYVNSIKSEPARQAFLTTQNCTGNANTCIEPSSAAAFKPLELEQVTYFETIDKLFKSGCLFSELTGICKIYGDYIAERAVAERNYYNALPDGEYSSIADAIGELKFPVDQMCAAAMPFVDASEPNTCFTRALKVVVADKETALLASLDTILQS